MCGKAHSSPLHAFTNILAGVVLFTLYQYTNNPALLPFLVYMICFLATNISVLSINYLRSRRKQCTLARYFGRQCRRRKKLLLKFVARTLQMFILSFQASMFLYVTIMFYSFVSTTVVIVHLERDSNSSLRPLYNLGALCSCWFIVQALYFIGILSSNQVEDHGYALCDIYKCTVLNPKRLRRVQPQPRPMESVRVEQPRRQHYYKVDNFVYEYECEFHSVDTTPSLDCAKCTCCICLESMHQSQVTVLEGCLHDMHKQCWIAYFSANRTLLNNLRCPQCRHPIVCELIEMTEAEFEVLDQSNVVFDLVHVP